MVEDLDLPDKDASRARLVTSIFVDAMAPSNNFFANPTAMKTLFDTGGMSAVKGLQNLIQDMTEHGGLPSSVDAFFEWYHPTTMCEAGAFIFQE